MKGSGSCCFWIEEERASSTSPPEEGDLNANTTTEYNVLFDEDRFYYLKRLRSNGMYIPLFNDDDFSPCTSSFPDAACSSAVAGAASVLMSKLDTQSTYSLSMDHFNLVIDTFLRGQLLSSHLSSRSKETMSFW